MSDIWYGNLCVYEWYLIPVSVWEILDTFVCMSDTRFLCVYELSDSCVFMSDIWYMCVYEWYLIPVSLWLISVSFWVISDICVIMCDIWYLCVFQVRTRWWLLDLEIHSFRWTNIQENSQNPLGTTHGTAICTTTNSTQATPPGRGLERVSVPNTSHFTGISYASKTSSIFATIAVRWIFKMILCAIFLSSLVATCYLFMITLCSDFMPLFCMDYRGKVL